MKLLRVAVSLVAAASAATNHTAVYGVHPPGLGVGVFSGLSNMQQCLFALVLDAKRHPGGGAAISLPSLRWRGSWSKAASGSRYIPHEQVWSLDGWSSKLPPLVDAPPTIVDAQKFRTEPLFRKYNQYISLLRKRPRYARDAADEALDASFVPTAPILARADRLATELGLTSNNYGCLHARMEKDLYRNFMGTKMRSLGLLNFARLARGLRRRTELAGVDRVFVAIDAAHITNDTRKGLGRGAWRGVPFVYKRPISPDAKGPSSPVENTLLADAIVDRTLCVRAKWFVGWPGSTFSNQITLSRHYALGTNASKNYYYNARGVFPRLDDGRLIRDAYDRRERPGKKRRGPESPADWRRVPRRHAVAGSRGIAESF